MFNYFSMTERPRIALDCGGWESALKFRHLHAQGIQLEHNTTK